MKKHSRLNTWLLLFAMTVMVNRVLLPFTVPVLLVHEGGYVEVCSWGGTFERILLDADGNQVESKQPFSYSPDFTPASLFTAPEAAKALSQVLPDTRSVHPPYRFSDLSVHLSRPPPSRAPPVIS